MELGAEGGKTLERNLEGLLQRVRAVNTVGRVLYFPQCTAYLLRARSSTRRCPVATAHVNVVTKWRSRDFLICSSDFHFQRVLRVQPARKMVVFNSQAYIWTT